MYDTILVPVDGSDQADQAVEHAVGIAAKFGSTIHALHVVDDRGSGRAAEAVSELSPNAPERQEMQQRREEAGSELTNTAVERARVEDVEARGVVVEGDPAEVVTDYATDEGMDLIVMGARGRSAVGKFLLGDVAGKVARHAETPVLLVRPEE